MYATKNTLPEKVRSNVINLLQKRLGDCIDLLLNTKQAHWNVKGENFIALHKLFDEIHETCEDWVDLIAERIMQLGGSCHGTARSVAARTLLPEYPLTISDGRDHCQALSTSLAYFGEYARKAIAELDRLEDRDSSDIFTEISRGVDQYLWMVEAHTQISEAPAERNLEVA